MIDGGLNGKLVASINREQTIAACRLQRMLLGLAQSAGNEKLTETGKDGVKK